jgi:hypothetical protein
MLRFLYRFFPNKINLCRFGKNEQMKNVFLTMFISMARLILARVLDPATARQVGGVITGTGGIRPAGKGTYR